MTGRAALLAVTAFVATALPVLGQTTFAPDLQPLVDALQSGKANGATVKATDAYVAAHPADATATRCNARCSHLPPKPTESIQS